MVAADKEKHTTVFWPPAHPTKSHPSGQMSLRMPLKKYKMSFILRTSFDSEEKSRLYAATYEQLLPRYTGKDFTLSVLMTRMDVPETEKSGKGLVGVLLLS